MTTVRNLILPGMYAKKIEKRDFLVKVVTCHREISYVVYWKPILAYVATYDILLLLPHLSQSLNTLHTLCYSVVHLLLGSESTKSKPDTQEKPVKQVTY